MRLRRSPPKWRASMRSDSFWAKIVRASRPGPPLLRLTASPWWTEVLVAAGAQRGKADDCMAVKYPGGGHSSSVRDPIRDRYGSSIGPVIQPRRYVEARTIGEQFRSGNPVLMDLSGLSDTDARRLVDFAAGLIFGLRGSIDKIANRVFLLTPAVSASWDNASGHGGIVITSDGRILIASEQGEQPILKDGTDSMVYGGDLLDLLDAVPSR
jgi:Cell division protein SepF